MTVLNGEIVLPSRYFSVTKKTNCILFLFSEDEEEVEQTLIYINMKMLCQKKSNR